MQRLLWKIQHIACLGTFCSSVCAGDAASNSCVTGGSKTTALLQISTNHSAGKMGVDPRQAKADNMIKRFKNIIEELEVEIMQCEESIEWLNKPVSQNAYIVNAMIPFVGKKAMSCHLADHTVHLHPPQHDEETCVFYCGEMDCPAALTYMSNTKEKLSKCGNVLYLQGGALCFVENKVPLQQPEHCSQIVKPHKPNEMEAFLKELEVRKVSCKEAPTELSRLKEGTKSYVIWNTMIPIFDQAAASCNLVDACREEDADCVRGEVPTEYHEECLLYCGEASCPMALREMLEKKGELRENCGALVLLEGGAKCFLEQGQPSLEDTDGCRGIVAPEPSPS